MARSALGALGLIGESALRPIKALSGMRVVIEHVQWFMLIFIIDLFLESFCLRHTLQSTSK